MDILPEPNAPEPSVHSCNSPQSGAQPAMLGRAWSQVHVAAIHAPSINQFACLRYLLTLHNLSAPIEPPHRHSSLAFSQFLQASDPAFLDAESLVTPQPTASHTPSRSLSNVGRKRALVSPLTRPAATPGHVSQMQRIFQDAKASLQLDAAIASSPAGSIASRLPGTGANKGLGHHRNNIGLNATDWRYSTVPQGLAEADLDVREPFPAESPGLPDHDFAASGRTEPVEREPMSSGFTSPVAAEEADVVMGNDASPTRGPTSSSSNNEKPTASPLATPVCGRLSARSMASTELEQPMRKMHVSHVDAWLNGVLHDSPNAQREQRRRSKSAKARDSTTHDVLDGDTHLEVAAQDIILSTPAKAAAQSAKLKRDLLGNGVRTFSNKEDVRPESHQASYPLGCTTPTANLLRVPTVQITPSPDFSHSSPPPSPIQPVQLPPVPPFRRVDSKGSPFPILKERSSNAVDMITSQQQWQGYYLPPPPQQFASPPQQPQTSPPYHQQNPMAYSSPQQHRMASSPLQHHPFLEPPAKYNKSAPTIRTSHLRGPPPYPALPGVFHSCAADRPFYSFSTAAAAHSGSSPAPDSRIRDAYRTDTLTPFEVPTTRFRKIGLGAAAQARSATRINAFDGFAARIVGPDFSSVLTGGRRAPVNDPRIGLSRANTAGARKYYAHSQQRARGPKSPEEVTFRSSPPRPAGNFPTVPRRKKLRRSVSGDDGLSSAREEEVASPSGAAPSIEPAEEMDHEVGAQGTDRSLQASDEEFAGLENEKHETENADDGTSSIEAVCGNGRMLVRKKRTTKTTTKKDFASPLPDQKPYTDEDDVEEVRELSPYVTPYRKGKGKGPKVKTGERRTSYWDGDILPSQEGGEGMSGKEWRNDEADKENWPPWRDRGFVAAGGGDDDGVMEIEHDLDEVEFGA